MRGIALMLCSSLAFAQAGAFAQATGKPGVTDPIKDPRQIPGNPNPGPIPRATPQPVPPGASQSGAEAKPKKAKKKNQKSRKATPRPERSESPER